MLIVLEGLEGVGKTSLGQAAAALLDAEYVKTPPAQLNGVRAYIASLDNPAVNFHFYFAGLLAVQRQIGGDGLVLCDRYLRSTIAYHDAGRSFETPLSGLDLLAVPDLTVHVTCTAATRNERVAARGNHIYDRPIVNEVAIEEYFASVADVKFENERPFQESVAALVDLIGKRLC